MPLELINTWVNLLGFVIVPIVIFILPILFEAVKTRKFLALIKRELEEMVPDETAYSRKWHRYLDKRFIHEKIFGDQNISENRDFILSLPPDISYHIAQLWTQFDKATASRDEEDLAKKGASWCYHLYVICEFFDCREWLKRHTVYFIPWAVSRKLPRKSRKFPQNDCIPPDCRKSQNRPGYTLADRRKYGDFYLSVCEPWMDLIIKYHPDLKEPDELRWKKNRQLPKPNELSVKPSKSI